MSNSDENIWVSNDGKTTVASWILYGFFGIMFVLAVVGAMLPEPESNKTLGDVIREQENIRNYRAAKWRKENGLGTLSDHILY